MDINEINLTDLEKVQVRNRLHMKPLLTKPALASLPLPSLKDAAPAYTQPLTEAEGRLSIFITVRGRDAERR